MFSVKYAMIIIAIFIILYFLYNYNKKSTEIIEIKKQENKQDKENKQDEENNIENMTSESKITKKLGVYYTDWCGYSKQFLKQLESGLSDELKKNEVDVVLVDCEKNKDVCNAMGVEGFPTLILHTSKGNVVYNGARDNDSILNFVR